MYSLYDGYMSVPTHAANGNNKTLDSLILVYKQTVLPLTEYVSFVLSLNTKLEIEKLQKLQNRALRMCYNVQIPKDVRTSDLHVRSRLNSLEERRKLQLYNIMFDLKQKGLFEKMHNRNTRNADKYIFDTNHVNLDIYVKSPYYVGAKYWNDLPKETQNSRSKMQFKTAIKKVI